MTVALNVKVLLRKLKRIQYVATDVSHGGMDHASVHWYCSKCEDKHLQGRSSNVWKSLNAINQQQKKTEMRKMELQIMESMKKDLLTIKLFETKLKRNVQLTSEVEQDKIVILATYCSSRQIRKSGIVSKSKERSLPFIQTKNYYTLLLQHVVVYI